MIGVTEAAIIRVKEIMEEQNKQDHYLHVYVAGGGCSGFRYGMALSAEDEIDDDFTITEHNGIRLAVDPQSITYLEGATVDYVETLLGAGFKVDNPNSVSTCGCGHSFKAKE